MRAPRGVLSLGVTPDKVGLVDARAFLQGVSRVSAPPRREDFADSVDARPPRDDPADSVDERGCPAPRLRSTASPAGAAPPPAPPVSRRLKVSHGGLLEATHRPEQEHRSVLHQARRCAQQEHQVDSLEATNRPAPLRPPHVAQASLLETNHRPKQEHRARPLQARRCAPQVAHRRHPQARRRPAPPARAHVAQANLLKATHRPEQKHRAGPLQARRCALQEHQAGTLEATHRPLQQHQGSPPQVRLRPPQVCRWCPRQTHQSPGSCSSLRSRRTCRRRTCWFRRP